MLIHHVTRATRHLLFWSLIAIAFGMTAVRFFLLDINSYKLELADKIRQTTQLPIHIGALGPSMHRLSPGLILKDITIENSSDADNKPAIELKEVRIGIDLLKLLLSGDPLASARITLVGAKLDIIRTLDGHITIKGLQNNAEQPLWLLHGKQYEILQSDVTWQDMKNNTKQFRFKNLNLVLKNHYLDQTHELHMQTTLPEEYGDTLRISAQSKGNEFNAEHINGELYIEGVNLQGPALAENFPSLGLKIESGSGDLRIWSQWQNTAINRVSGYIQAQQIKLANPEGNKLKLETLSGNLSWFNKQGKWRLGVYDLDIFANQQHWIDGEIYLQKDQQGNSSGLIKQLNLQALAQTLAFFTGEESPYQHLLKLNPSGNIKDLRFFSQTGQGHYALQGEFTDLGIEALDALPKIKGLTGQISGDDNSGHINFKSNNILVDAGDVFRNTLTVKRLAGELAWLQQANSWLFSSRNLVLDSPDFKTSSQFNLTIPKKTAAPSLDLLTRFGSFNDVSRLALYFPVKYMDKDAVKWMDQAFIAGRIRQGQLRIQGQLDQLPFTHGQGLLEAVFAVENGELQFHPDWPHALDLSADFHYLGEDLRVAITKGHSEGVEIKQLLVSINSLPISERAAISGQLQSKLQNALQYLQKTPLHTFVDPLQKVITLENTTQVDLNLSVPYHDHMHFGVNVDAHLNNAGLLFKPINLAVNQINGTLHFSEERMDSDKLTGKTLGYPIQGVVNRDINTTQLQFEGSTGVDNLQRQFPFLKTDFAKGIFAYQVDLNIPNLPGQQQTLTVSSNLQGLALTGQEFISKTANEQRQLKLAFQFNDKQFLPMQLHYGNDLNAALLLDIAQSRLYSGHIIFGTEQANTLEQAGLEVEIKKPVFKVSQALGALSADNNNWPVLRKIVLETDQLIWLGQNLGPIQCHLEHMNQIWQGAIDSTMAKGRLSIPDQLYGNDAIKLDMVSMNLSEMNALNFNAAEESITNFPLIDIDSQQLLWRSVNLGKLKLQTERLNKGIHFKKIKLSGANKDINFTADWIKQLRGSSTLISGSLNMDGFGPFLSELGFSDDFKETHADISFTGGWENTPQQFSLGRLNGQLQIKLKDGRISSIEPGLGRLLGLISMEQWAKRLSLDFTDIYRQGLAFDRITGDLKITNGVAYTDNLLVDAVAAKMKIVGEANLVDKTLNNRVAVIPKSSDALPIAGTIVGGIAEIVTNAITNNYKEGYFFGSEYKVTGHWGNIEVTPLKDQDGLVNKTWRGLTDFGWMK